MGDKKIWKELIWAAVPPSTPAFLFVTSQAKSNGSSQKELRSSRGADLSSKQNLSSIKRVSIIQIKKNYQ